MIHKKPSLLLTKSIFGALLMAFSLTCESDPTGSHDKLPQQLSILSGAGNGTIVAYDSPNRNTKPDTLTLDFTYSQIDFSAIHAYALLSADSFIWHSDTLFTTGNGKARAQWIPKDNPAFFAFCGRRTGFCILSTAEITVKSDTFTLIGNKAVELVSSIPQDTLFSNDTFVIEYRINSDKISNIQVFLSSGSEDDTSAAWIELDAPAVRIEDTPPIRVLRKAFIPSRFGDLFDSNATYTIKFLLRDYGVSDPSATLTTNSLTFTNRNR